MFACTPHPGLGTVIFRSLAVDLATCGTRIERAAAPTASAVRVVVKSRQQSIVFRDRVVITMSRSPGPIMPRGLSPDRRWILYAINPYGSASLAADGLALRLVSVSSGPVHVLGTALGYDDYLSWCGGRLVFTNGIDREATRNKQLEVAAPPGWKPRALTALGGCAWGSIGPLLLLGYSLGYYGHQAWRYTVR